jgi:hypothetical protein
MPEATLQRIVTAKRPNPRVRNLAKIALGLGVSLDEVWLQLQNDGDVRTTN